MNGKDDDLIKMYESDEDVMAQEVSSPYQARGRGRSPFQPSQKFT